MRNKTSIYLKNDYVEIELCNNSYFNKCRNIEKKNEKNKKALVQILRLNDNKKRVHINVWYWPETTGILIASLEFTLENNQRQDIKINFPKEETWTPLYYLENISAPNFCEEKQVLIDEKSTHYKTVLESVGNKEHIVADVVTFPTIEDAKRQFKYIKKNNLVSKFHWDHFTNTYDCYCRACEVYGLHVSKDYYWQRSWVGNPDIGFVRPLKYNYKPAKDEKIFKYKTFDTPQLLYKPVEATEYEKLQFYNKEDFDEIIEVYGIDESFEDLWKIKTNKEDIFENANIRGGAWRDLKNGDIISNEDDVNNECLEKVNEKEATFEKVVTLGWHRTDPKNAVRCPVCEDLYEIICRSGYNPLSLPQRIRESLSIKLRFFFRRIVVIFSDLKFNRKSSRE